MLKYSEQLHIARSLGKALAQSYIRSGLPRPDALVPVPLHPRRLRERGFNQASEICNTLGEKLGISVRNGFLYRCLDTSSQTGLGESARRRNILDCFGTRGETFGTHIALVDDVVTSGSTMREAAKTLKRAGIGAVSGWAVAATRRMGR